MVDHKNYYKLLADFSLYDSRGNYCPHQKVEYNMPDQVPYLDENGHKRYMKSETHIRNELEKELKVRDDIAEKLADKSEAGLIPRFIKAVNGESSENTLDNQNDMEYTQAVKGNYKYPQNKNGEFMIDAYDVYGDTDVTDVIVFANGTIEIPNISKIIKINTSDTDLIEEIRRDIYAFERRGIQCQAGVLLDIYPAADFIWAGIRRGYGRKNSSHNNRFGTGRVASEAKVNPIVEFHFDEENGTITTIYANGQVVTEKIGESDTSYSYTPTKAESEPSPREIISTMLDSVAESERDKNLLPKYRGYLSNIEKNKAEIARLKGGAQEFQEVTEARLYEQDRST